MKTYSFYKSEKGGERTLVEVLEKDLKQWHIDLMFSQEVEDFEKLPQRVQGKLAGYIINKMMEKSDYEIKLKQ